MKKNGIEYTITKCPSVLGFTDLVVSAFHENVKYAAQIRVSTEILDVPGALDLFLSGLMYNVRDQIKQNA